MILLICLAPMLTGVLGYLMGYHDGRRHGIKGGSL